MKKVNELIGVKESETGLAPPSQWDLISDKQMMGEEQPLQVARCTKIINPGGDDAKYVINVRQIAKFVVDVREGGGGGGKRARGLWAVMSEMHLLRVR